MAYPINHYPNDAFADRLQAECARHDLDPSVTLPSLLGYSSNSVRQWLLGCTRPGTRSLRKLADLFGVPVNEWRALLHQSALVGGDVVRQPGVWLGTVNPEPVPAVSVSEPVEQLRVCPDCNREFLDADGTCPACAARARARRVLRGRLEIWRECGLPEWWEYRKIRYW